MFGTYRNNQLPRVLHISVARYRHDLPRPGESLEFLVTIHEEGTGITWQQNVDVDSGTEKYFIEATHNLHLWSLNRALTPEKARVLTRKLGVRLYDTFIGVKGDEVLCNITPTAVLLDVDETILNLPWELITPPQGVMSQQIPFGRLVTTRTIVKSGRDPLQEDTVVRILAIVNPTSDLAGAETGGAALSDLEGHHGGFSVKLDVLTKNEATLERFNTMLTIGDYDILHFAGHGFLDPTIPGSSALRFADGNLIADDVLQLPWKSPPYFVFNSACESGRAVGGQRLISERKQSNGLAAAFLTAGVYGYAGYFWPVTDVGAGIFTRTFYQSLFIRENVGLAFLDARKHTLDELDDVSDLTGHGAILYGDAASGHRRDMVMAA